MNTNRLGSLATRMLNGESSSTSSQNDDRSSIKRNLFGCRLDREQLQSDLQQMFAEQRRVKSAQWSFDFETLRPIQGGRVSWRKVKVSNNMSDEKENPTPNPTIAKQEETKTKPEEKKFNIYSSTEISVLIGSDEDYDEEEEEEEDEALAVPEFYKRQRRLKLVEVDKNRLNVLNNAAPITNNPAAKTSTNVTKVETQSKPKAVTAVTATPVKPKVSRASRKVAHFEQLGNILTYSENRKDTLRSASASTNRQTTTTTRTLKQSLNSAFVSQSAKKAPSKPRNSRNQPNSDDKMRQQTLHDLNVFKQRKKRLQMPGELKQVGTNKTAATENPASHFLRSQSTTTTTTTTTKASS